MKSSDVATLRDSIESIEQKKKKVKITTINRTAGTEVRDILYLHASSLSGGGELKLYPVVGGISNKDFTIRFTTVESAEMFKDNLQAIIDRESGDEPYVDPMTGEPYAPTDTEGNGSHTLLIVAAIIVLIAIGIFVWKKRK